MATKPWIVFLDGVLYIYLENRSLHILDSSNNHLEVFRVHNCIIHSISGYSVLVVVSEGIEYFTYRHKQYYIVVKNEDSKICLYVHNNQSIFARLTCELSHLNDEDEGWVVIHPYLPRVIYANLQKQSKKTPATYISIDDGQNFFEMKLRAHGRYMAASLNLIIPTELITYRQFPVPWMALFSATYENSLESEVISIDGGFIWELTPFPVFKAVVLNQGGVIIGINPYNNHIVYTYGQNSWFYSNNAFIDDELTVIYPDTPKPLMFLNILGTMIGRQYSTFVNIDFSNVNEVYKPVQVHYCTKFTSTAIAKLFTSGRAASCAHTCYTTTSSSSANSSYDTESAFVRWDVTSVDPLALAVFLCLITCRHAIPFICQQNNDRVHDLVLQ
ncbi:hypothetical protein RF11_10994 [Thelohanellus kitauei]|uniref:VPS10 domain-containing receptor SorCS1 n=1 Tax=Thelohanellus kitauei TaxID=669202 RepID=A0A0C2JTM4_THEKT|nr:hypothetical protein RF11_10994 [Thelohanellus kitauei]